MRFAIMAWITPHTKAPSIFGVLDAENPTQQLPALDSHGHWSEYRQIEESRFKFADEAKKSIKAQGYYLSGAGVTITEAFGPPP